MKLFIVDFWTDSQKVFLHCSMLIKSKSLISMKTCQTSIKTKHPEKKRGRKKIQEDGRTLWCRQTPMSIIFQTLDHFVGRETRELCSMLGLMLSVHQQQQLWQTVILFYFLCVGKKGLHGNFSYFNSRVVELPIADQPLMTKWQFSELEYPCQIRSVLLTTVWKCHSWMNIWSKFLCWKILGFEIRLVDTVFGNRGWTIVSL